MHNLEQLLHSAGPLDTQSSHIYLCFRSDPGYASTAEALDLLKNGACSTALTETRHAPSSILRRGHGKLEAAMLSERAYFHLPAPGFELNKAELVLRGLRLTYDAMIDGK